MTIAQKIQEAGFVSYCPVETIKRQPHLGPRGRRYGLDGRQDEYSRALFPGYLFMQIDAKFRPALIERGHLRIAIMRGPHSYLTLSDAQVNVVREIETAMAWQPAPLERKKPKKGDFVELLYGILRGEPATVLKVKGAKAWLKFNKANLREPVIVNANDLKVVS